MSSPTPQPVIPKSGTYNQEANTFSSVTDLYRFFQTKQFKASLSSPPLAKDVNELEFVVDKSALRVYTKIDGTLRHWSLT
jgi:hypothetical protein